MTGCKKLVSLNLSGNQIFSKKKNAKKKKIEICNQRCTTRFTHCPTNGMPFTPLANQNIFFG